MHIIAGKNGNFFFVRADTNESIIEVLSGLTFEEFMKCNAYAMMKKISLQNAAEFAAKNALCRSVIDNYAVFEDAVDIKVTQELLQFIERDDGRDRADSFDDDVKIDPRKYTNGFTHAAPRELSGLITDSMEIPDKLVPEFLKKIGIGFKRELLSNFVQWNTVTYRVDIVPSNPIKYSGKVDNKAITLVEYCYVFQSDDWRVLKKIDKKIETERQFIKKWFFAKEKTDEELVAYIIEKMFAKDKAMFAKFSRMYEVYKSLRDLRHDYRGVLAHEVQHLKSKILLDNRRMKPNTKALSAEDLYFIMVEDERTASLCATIDRINKYWHDNNWDELLFREPCFKVLAEKSVASRNSLLKNMDFVVNLCLKTWNEEHLETSYKKFLARMPILEAKNSCAKGYDDTGSEFHRQLGMLYSFRVYNPVIKKYEFRKLDNYIKIAIPISASVQNNIIDKLQHGIDRKKNSIYLLKKKYGIADDVIVNAANIYDSFRRTKRVVLS